ncbi:rhomboid-like protein [Streptomyces sp. NPDC046939]|uniref:rhomboid-like protein n=1 Tax=Streptomyces sp. NPDC046939 TaxID=3155376 RepID=UPI0034023DA6
MRLFLRRAGTLAGSYVRDAPCTYLWLTVLLLTTVAAHHMDPHSEHDFLRRRSTNLHELATHPVRVLVSSALWTDGGAWWPYAVLYTVFHAQAERWLSTARWLVVVAAAHVLATLVSEGALLWAIRYGHAPTSAVDTLDIGVSYALAGSIGVLTHRITPPWRHVYLAAALLIYGVPLATTRTFTDLGHAAALLTGLACRPLGRGRPLPRTRPAQ